MKYDAFISYRHLEKDMFVAKGVHRALETAKIPRKIQKETGIKRIKRVFRDQEELPIGSDLTHNIDYALRESGFLIVICSPQTKESLWVMKEIDTFISLHGRENILAVLVDGEPVDSFPPQLCVDEEGNPVEPLAADVRGKNKREISKKIKSESLRLAAAILHCDYDDLKQRHRERRMRRNMAIVAGVAVLGVAFGIYNAYNLKKINENYQQKLINESKVLAATSIDVLEEGDRATAGLIALKGLPVEESDRPFVSNCMFALEQATGAYNNGDDTVKDKILKHKLPVDKMKNSVDGTMIMSYDYEDNAYFWDSTTGELLFFHNCDYIDGERNEVTGVGAIDDKLILATHKFLTAFNRDGSVAYEVELADKGVYSGFSSDDEYVAISEYDALEVFSLKDGAKVATLEKSAEDRSYSRQMWFSSDHTYLAIDHSADEGQDAVVSVFNIKTGEEKQMTVRENDVLSLRFSVDDCLIVASINSDVFYHNGEASMYAQKFDYKTGIRLWEKELPYYNFGMNTSYSTIKDRNYTDSNGTAHPEVLVSSSRALYTLDANTGEIIATFEAPSDIQTVYMAVSLPNAYVTCSEGRLYCINGTTGFTYSDNTEELSNGSVLGVLMGGGRIVVQEYRSPNLTILSGLADDTREDLEEHGLHVVDYHGSPDESTFALEAEAADDRDKSTYVIYDTDTGKKKASFDLDQFYTMKFFYADADTVVVPGARGTIYAYSISNDKLDEIKLFSPDTITNKYSRSFNNKYMSVHEDQIKTIDLQTRQITSTVTPEERFFYAVNTNDGSRIYGYDYDYGFMYIDLKTGEETHPLPDYSVVGVAISQDDKMAALTCSDGQLRIFKTENWEQIDSLEFYGDYEDLLVFSADGDKLFMQGHDLYFKIYDISEHEYVFSSDGQMLEIEEVSYDAENNTVTMYNYTNMYVVDVEGNSFIHKAPLGKIYFPEKQKIICADSSQLYSFKVKTLDDLVGAFRKEFGDRELTTEQKLIYNID